MQAMSRRTKEKGKKDESPVRVREGRERSRRNAERGGGGEEEVRRRGRKVGEGGREGREPGEEDDAPAAFRDRPTEVVEKHVAEDVGRGTCPSRQTKGCKGQRKRVDPLPSPRYAAISKRTEREVLIACRYKRSWSAAAWVFETYAR